MVQPWVSIIFNTNNPMEIIRCVASFYVAVATHLTLKPIYSNGPFYRSCTIYDKLHLPLVQSVGSGAAERVCGSERTREGCNHGFQ